MSIQVIPNPDQKEIKFKNLKVNDTFTISNFPHILYMKIMEIDVHRDSSINVIGINTSNTNFCCFTGWMTQDQVVMPVRVASIDIKVFKP